MKIADMRRKPKPPYVYVGRAMPFQKIEPSPLGNPFKLSSGEKIEDVLLKYRQWLFSKIKDKDRSVMALLE
jgi:hypothetical protein